MSHFLRRILAAVLLVLCTAAIAAPQDGINVRLTAASPVVRGDVDIVVTLTVTNTNRHPVNLLRWQLPTGDLDGQLFSIVRDNARVAYTGPRIKRAAPGAADFLKLDPGVSWSTNVELTGAYDLSRNGRYDIRFESRGGHGANAVTLKSDTLYLWLEGRTGVAAPSPSVAAPLAPSIAFTGNCSASQQTDLRQAVVDATSYANGAQTYLSASASPTPRYKAWFDANYTLGAGGWSTAQSHFVNIASAFGTQALTLDCKCKQKNVYAYVYPNKPHQIYLCGAFWTAPRVGTDSKAGTLIHEMSHFTVVAATDDWVYGQAGAGSLAASDPTKALDNADNHEYFAENTPALQ